MRRGGCHKCLPLLEAAPTSPPPPPLPHTHNPGTALQLAEVHPQQGTLCRRLGGGSVVMAEADEEPDALTLSVVAPRAPADAHAALGAVLAHWAAQHPQLPVCFGPALLLQARSEVRLPQGLFIAFGTRRKVRARARARA